MYKNFETGRSMIEMLGVLAIIGVLSVGGIAGYSKAMEKFKVNKIIQDYNSLIFGLLEYRQNFQKNIVGEPNLIDIIIALNLVPNNWTKLNDKYLQDNYGNWVNVRYRQTNNSYSTFDKEGLIIDFYLGGLTIDEAGNRSSDNFNDKICFEMFRNVIQPLHSTISGVLTMGGATYYGDTWCKNKAFCLNNMTLSQMKTACNFCDKKNRCTVTVIF